MDDWGDGEIYYQQDQDKGWARTCLAMSLVFLALALVLVLIGVALLAVVGLLL
jgi:hypothetical protein